MNNTKTYYSYKNEKGEFLEIYWVKDKFINKGYHELTVSFNGMHHSYDMNDIDRYAINSIAGAYIKNITLGFKWVHDDKFMDGFIQILTPIVEEFKKDVEYHHSFDGWIGRIFIDPIENFVDWLKK
jgi:hypothetical protein